MTDDYSEKKNPFFLPALIVILFPVVIFVLHLDGVYLFWVTPYVALVLSFAGLVSALIYQKRFAGCVFCLVLSILELFVPAYLSHNINPPKPTEVTRSLTPEESSVIEEMDRALGGKTITVTRAAK